MNKIPRLADQRTLAEKIAMDARSRRKLQRSGRPTISAYQNRSDEELCDELRRLGIVVTRESFAALAADHDSAETLAQELIRSLGLELHGFQSDQVWFCLRLLWERWLPERPSCEQVDDWVAEGAARAHGDDPAAACAAWLRAWGFVRDLARERGLRSLDDVDAVLRGSEVAFNWVQDFEAALHNAGLEDPAWQREGVRFCQEYLALFEQADHNITENMRRALAGFHYGLDESVVADRLYEEWLGADPQWGWGWIGWSDEYGLWQPPKDVARAEQLLQRGLAVPGVRDERHMLDRLQSLYADAGRDEEARAVRQRLEASAGAGHDDLDARHTHSEAAPMLAPQTVVRAGPKVGRNDPCPCGSGRKYKKCCLK